MISTSRGQNSASSRIVGGRLFSNGVASTTFSILQIRRVTSVRHTVRQISWGDGETTQLVDTVATPFFASVTLRTFDFRSCSLSPQTWGLATSLTSKALGSGAFTRVSRTV